MARSPDSIIELARSLRYECNTGEPKFAIALQALDALGAELEYYKSLTSKGISPQTLRNLEAHLTPCQKHLNTIATIRRKYRSEISGFESATWKASDGETFAQAVGNLWGATDLLRGTLRVARDMQKATQPTKGAVRGRSDGTAASALKDASSGMLSQPKPSTQPRDQETQVPLCRNGASCRVYNCQFTHPSASPRRYGVSCTDGSCAFEHPKAKPRLCRNGADCKLLGCKYSHPKTADCRYGVNCASPDCRYKHLKVAVCRYGADCTSVNCNYAHPKGKACRYGTQCHDRQCMYQHPPPPYSKNPVAGTKGARKRDMNRVVRGRRDMEAKGDT